jgi:phospholipid transport system substrate-binding protein
VTVHNTFKRASGGKPVGFDYAMRKTEQGWKIYDIVVEGVSLVLTYRSEFDGVVRQSGVDGLIKALASKNAPAAATGGSASKSGK